ncbi:hypothetical protein [Nostoc sp. WHI]|uniref:hypothetical protein n=1 Tax=Nostoc sp. WHI TaxID=2650611 RepID=UPI0018C7EF95|nr:hypothetical protein [Nostoc sp. WHI]MBG1268875.1 hypothetical protein [Nostoc sp. WHI]
MKNHMPFEQFNDSYLKNILQNSENLNKAYTSAFSKISEQISGIDQRFTGRARLLPYSELLENLSGKSRLFAYSELLENLSGKSRLMPQDKLIQDNLYIDLNKQISSWQKLLQPSLNISQPSRQLKEIVLASRVWDKSFTEVTRQIQELNLFSKHPALVQSLLKPSRVYTDFVEKTYQRLEQSPSEKFDWALETSLHLAEDQLLTATELLVNIIAVPEDEELALREIDLLLPIVQQDELITIVESCEEEDEESLILLSPAAQASAQVNRIWKLIVQCNEVMQTKEQKEMFKPTTKLIEACTNLHWIIPQNKLSFANFIDYFYFTFYEGAGKDNLRFLIKHGGVLDEKTDCDFIWCIKHLRNKWLRHDADHGKETDIKKSWKDLSDKFKWLGINHTPIREEDFRKLHRSLLKEAESFLEKILEKLIS